VTGLYHRHPMLRILETTRLYLLILTVPATLLWARGLEPLGVVTGPLLVLTHASVTALWMASLVRGDMERGRGPHLGLSTSQSMLDGEVMSLWFPVVGLLALILSLTLLVANFWIGLGAILAGLLALRQGSLGRRDRLALVELITPVILLAGPGLLFAAHDWPAPRLLRIFGSERDTPLPAEAGEMLAGQVVRPELMTGGALQATLLIAAAMATFFLLTLLRDRCRDAMASAVTTATRRSAVGVAALAWLWLVGVATLGVIGAGLGWWHWSAAAALAWAAIGACALVTIGVFDHAANVWFVGSAIASVAASLSA